MAKVALLIGVSEYEVGLNPLPAAVKDVVALERILKDSEMGDFDEVKVLTNPEPQAMQFEVETLFSGRSKDDFVLLFFSGHGIKDDSNNLYFATRITKKSAKGDLIRSTAVPARFVHEVMNNSRAKRQAIILDCCFSGAFDPSLQSKDDGSVDLQGQLGAEGRVVLTSSSSTQYSFEQQGSDLSLYTRYLIEGIETGAGDHDEDGKISVRELHDYATSRVQETVPSMTPKLITLKDMGFDLVLAKAKVTDPKLRYRKAASKCANAGTIRPAGRAMLNTLRQQLELTIEDATVIENEVLRPYQERLANLQQYRETLIASAEHEYPLNQLDLEDLNTLQKMLGLEDKDVLPIQQEVEAQFTQQSAVYQQSLIQYEQALTDAIKQEFPFSQQSHQDLKGLQQSLNLRDEDITRIGQRLIQQAELKYQEKLRQEAEQQRQEQGKAEYENNLRRYEQEFTKAIQAEYPLNHSVLGGLKAFQQQLGLKYEDVTRIEKPISDPIEAKYQEKLNQQKQAEQQRQRELEERRKMDQEKLKKQAEQQRQRELEELRKIEQEKLRQEAECQKQENKLKEKEKLEQKCPIRGDDLRLDLKLNFREAIFGGEQEIRIPHLETCKTCTGSGAKAGTSSNSCVLCNGTGRVRRSTRTPFGNFEKVSVCPKCAATGKVVEEKCEVCSGNGRCQKTKILRVAIPAGVDNETRLRVSGEGDAGLQGGSAGDLYVYLSVDEDKKFKRDDVNILSSVEISQEQASSGCNLSIDTIGGTASLKIPCGIKNKTVIRLPSYGVPYLGNPSQRGDHLVTIKIN